MAFKLDTMSNEIQTEDGLTVGWIRGGTIALDLKVSGEPEQLLAFMRSVAAAYEVIHPPGAYIDIDLDQSDTNWSGPELLEEQTAKADGKVIRVHMNDVDDWPSDLHGHVVNHPGQKIDIYTGEIYRIQGRKLLGTLGKKDLARVQTELRKSDWAAAKLDAHRGD